MISENSSHNDERELEVVVSGSGALARVYGRIDIDSSPVLRAALLKMLQAAPLEVTIDLSGVSHIDSSGVATLIEALKIARSNDAELKLQGLQGRLLRLFQSTGILPLFEGQQTPRQAGL
jgi:anti-anti-sigma factor